MLEFQAVCKTSAKTSGSTFHCRTLYKCHEQVNTSHN